MLPGRGDPRTELIHDSQSQMTFELVARRTFPLTQRQQFLPQFPCCRQIAPRHVEDTEPLERGPSLVGLASRPAEFADALVGLLDLHGGEALGGRKRWAQGHQHIEFPLDARRAVRKPRKLIACLDQMFDRLLVRRVLGCTSSGFKPIAECGLGLLGGAVVVGQNLGVRPRRLRESPLRGIARSGHAAAGAGCAAGSHKRRPGRARA
jgi:hypothetical protein